VVLINMGLNTARYYLRETFTSLVRNGWLSLASMGTVAVSLLILGFSLLLILNANRIADSLESMLEISVFLEDGTKEEQVKKLGENIKLMPGVKEVEFIPKEKALENMRKSYGADKLEALDYNPLPDAFRVKTADPRQVSVIAGDISKFTGVKEVLYGQGLVEKLLVVTRSIRIAGWVAMVILGAAAVFLISVTIRISVFSRRKEIGIMKFLGATNWFIRFPFLLEGMILGVAGALLAAIIVYYGYFFAVERISSLMPFFPLVNQFSEVLPVYISILGLGLVIGAFGSALSVRRFLKV
jgi:cell division transport system permease protein